MNILGSPPPGKTPTVSFRARRGCEGRGGGRRRHKDVISVAIKTTGQGPHNLRSGDFFFWRQKKKTWWRVRGHTSGASHSSTFYPKLIAILIYLKLLIKSLLTYHSCFWIFNCFLTLSLPQVSKIKFRQNSKFHQLYMLRWEQIVLCGVSFERSHNRIN